MSQQENFKLIRDCLNNHYIKRTKDKYAKTKAHLFNLQDVQEKIYRNTSNIKASFAKMGCMLSHYRDEPLYSNTTKFKLKKDQRSNTNLGKTYCQEMMFTSPSIEKLRTQYESLK